MTSGGATKRHKTEKNYSPNNYYVLLHHYEDKLLPFHITRRVNSNVSIEVQRPATQVESKGIGPPTPRLLRIKNDERSLHSILWGDNTRKSFARPQTMARLVASNSPYKGNEKHPMWRRLGLAHTRFLSRELYFQTRFLLSAFEQTESLTGLFESRVIHTDARDLHKFLETVSARRMTVNALGGGITHVYLLGQVAGAVAAGLHENESFHVVLKNLDALHLHTESPRSRTS